MTRRDNPPAPNMSDVPWPQNMHGLKQSPPNVKELAAVVDMAAPYLPIDVFPKGRQTLHALARCLREAHVIMPQPGDDLAPPPYLAVPLTRWEEGA